MIWVISGWELRLKQRALPLTGIRPSVKYARLSADVRLYWEVLTIPASKKLAHPYSRQLGLCFRNELNRVLGIG